MDYDEQDNEVVSLLSKLREADSVYPVEMMTARRQSYIKQIGALGLGTGAALTVKAGAKAAGGSSIPPVASAIVESALIVAIVAEASFVAFVNREKVLDIFRTISGQPTVEQVTAAPASSLPSHDLTEFMETEFTVSPEPNLAPTLMTETPTLVETPSPDVLVVTESGSVNESSSADAPVNSTPNPNSNNDNNNGNNGNHYGQTPRPERTKESGNNGGGTNQNNSDGGNNGNNGNNGNGRGH